MRATVVTRSQIAEKTIELQITPEEKIAFRPGQHVEITLLNMTRGDSRGHMRQLSIVSSPDEEHLRFVFRVSNSAWKETVLGAPFGSEVDVTGPFGTFWVPDDCETAVCIAGGVGIAPFMSMLKENACRSKPRKIDLIYANETPEASAYRNEIQHFAKKYRWFSFHEIWGRLTAEGITLIPPAKSTATYLLAGPPGMVAKAYRLLTSSGISEMQILTEEFIGY